MAAELFSTNGEMAHLHQLITRITLAGASISALILSVLGLALGNTGFLWEAFGPALTSVFLLPMVIKKRESAAVTFALATVSVVISYKLVGSSDTTVAATTAIVIMASLSVLFISRYVVAYVVVGMVCLALVPILWAERLEGAVATGLVMALAFLVGAVAFVLVRKAAGQVNNRYRLAFEEAPVALLELDWSTVRAYLDEVAVSDIETALQEDPDLLRQIVTRTQIVRANGEAARLFGVTHTGDLVGPVDPRFGRGEIAGWWAAQVVAMVEGRVETDDEVSLAAWGIEKWVAIRTISGRHPTGSASSILALTDITAARVHEQSLKDLIEAKDEFIATVSHELRTPLTAVVGLASELAENHQMGDEERSDLLGIVAGQSREIAFIVEDLLVAARADIGTVTVLPQPVDLTTLAREVGAGLGAELTVEVEGPSLTVLGDPIRIRQIVRNLLVNADRYGGHECHIVLREIGNTGWLEVRDSGGAIPKDDRERIFEAYQRAHERTGMTMAMGLGLSVSRRLARMMDGDLVYHHDGESVFRLMLPLLSSAEQIEPTPVRAVPVAASTG